MRKICFYVCKISNDITETKLIVFEKKDKEAMSPRSKMAARMAKRKGKKSHAFNSAKFNGVFLEEHKNDTVFAESCEALTEYACSGKTSVIFAYGNTGSGKTHTILG